jgi:hypothetical protein
MKGTPLSPTQRKTRYAVHFNLKRVLPVELYQHSRLKPSHHQIFYSTNINPKNQLLVAKILQAAELQNCYILILLYQQQVYFFVFCLSFLIHSQYYNLKAIKY